MAEKRLARDFLERLSDQQNHQAEQPLPVYCMKHDYWYAQRQLEPLKCWDCQFYIHNDGVCDPLKRKRK